MRAVSDAAGVELEVFMETIEIGHANVQVDINKYQGMEHAECMQAISNELTSGEFALERVGSGRGGVAVRGQKEIEDEICGDGGSIIPWQ